MWVDIWLLATDYLVEATWADDKARGGTSPMTVAMNKTWSEHLTTDVAQNGFV